MMLASSDIKRSISRPRVIGLTGAIASGKSTVAAMLRERGADVIDADEVYWDLLHPYSPLWTSIVTRFGPSIVAPDGQIDRGALGSIVFGDSRALAELDALTHPAVVADIRRRIAGSRAAVVVIEAVKLAHTGLLGDVDALWLVEADPEVRLNRLRERPGLDEAGARARIAASMKPLPDGVKATVVIDNPGSLPETAQQVAAAWQAMPWNRNSEPRAELVTTSQEDP